MECLHRFCRECIDKSMRLGNNECPACRTHCASRRSLRDDPNFDSLIAALYPDIDKYEEEELILCEEEKTRNKQIQASIAQIFQRQSEALTKKRKESPYAMRSQRNYRNFRPRRRRDSRGTEFQASDDNEDENDHDGGRDSSSADERSVEVRQRRCRRRRGPRSSQPSSSVANLDGGCMENDFEDGRESRGRSPGLVWSVEMLAWGRGGVRSNTRHGSGIGSSSRNARTARLSKLVDYLRGLGEDPDEFNVQVILISWDKNYAPSLQQPYLSCPPSLSIRQLCEYIALQTPLRAEEVEILVAKEMPDGQLTISANHIDDKESFPQLVDSHKHELQVLQEQETLAGLNASYCTGRGQLVLAYRPKQKRTGIGSLAENKKQDEKDYCRYAGGLGRQASDAPTTAIQLELFQAPPTSCEGNAELNRT
ncbi:hypothetical protein RJ641_015512 [Dillenia turbinata]|uniref:RING-type domain-containing protein n=1 Tax=Dillenia turbinata TaxID=194707 RepID=A0AAN8Z3S6_9MAGN